MKKNLLPFLSGMLCVISVFAPCLPAAANSAQTQWRGVYSTGAIAHDVDCPIQVERELLTFDIQEFPADYYEDPEAYRSYSGQVTAEYGFYNPADYTVTATLLFPMGNTPSYGISHEFTGLPASDGSTEKFNVAVNGSEVDKQLRHSFSYPYEQFELSKDLSRLSDGYRADDFYAPDLPVRKYTFRISDVDLAAYDAANAAFDLPLDLRTTKIFFPRQSGYSLQENNSIRLSTWVLENDPLVTIYAAGEPLDAPPEWTFYEDGGVKNGAEIPGVMTLLDTQELTFRDLAMSGWREDTGVSETDWYNAVVAMLLEDSSLQEGPVMGFDLTGQGLVPTLMCWYQYDITLKPGEHITNTVTAPMYPAIDMSMSPSVYDYTYLLSPAASWADFGPLEIVIRTPYHLTSCSLSGFSETEAGYSLTLPGLPDGELEFTLCESAEPVKGAVSHGSRVFLRILILLIFALILLTALILFLLLRKRKAKGPLLSLAVLVVAGSLFLPGCADQGRAGSFSVLGSKSSAFAASGFKEACSLGTQGTPGPGLSAVQGPGALDTSEDRGASDPSVDPKSTPSSGSLSPSSSSGSLSLPSSAGSLQVRGTQLCDSSGNPVQLRGISTHGLAWFPDYVNEDCFRDFKNQWNANVIRLAMYTAESGGYCTDGDPARLKRLVKNGIRYAAAQDLYVIVDWHILSDNNPNTHLSEATEFFDEISSEFSGANHILYEICNEPNGSTSWSDIKSYAQKIIPVIRANDPDAVIIVGTPNWSQFVDQAAADPITEYDNLMYALHFYAATHKEDLRSKMISAVSGGLPVFVTEYGICDASGNGGLDLDQANQWVETMNQWGISYVAWNLSNKNESSAVLKSSCSKTSGFSMEDLSDSGRWLYQMLTSGGGSLEGGSGSNAQPEPSGSSGQANASGSGQDTASGSGQANASGSGQDTASGSGSQGSAAGTSITNDSGIQVTAVIVNSWENGGVPYYQYSLTLKNTTSGDCSQWTVRLSCPSEMSLTDSWNGDYSLQGGQLCISSKDYNGAIPAGGSIDNIGFIVCGGKIE